MKKNTLYVDAALFEGVLIELGCKYEKQKGFVKVEIPGAAGRRVYIGNTQRVGRVDISGFEVPTDPDGEEFFAHVKDLGGLSFGAVKQQLDFEQTDGRTAESLVATLRAVIEHGASLGDAPPKAKSAPGVTASSPKPKGWMSDEERALLIAKVAKEKGVAVSPNAPVPASSETELTDAELEEATAPEAVAS